MLTKLEQAGAWVLIEEWLIHRTIDAMTLCQEFNQTYNMTLDWHKFSNYLDMLHSQNRLNVWGHNQNGMTQYSRKGVK